MRAKMLGYPAYGMRASMGAEGRTARGLLPFLPYLHCPSPTRAGPLFTRKGAIQMLHQVEELKAEASAAIETAEDESALAAAESKYLGRKGSVTALLRSMGKVDPSERATIGRAVNDA